MQVPAPLACINQITFAAFPILNLNLLENNLKETLKLTVSLNAFKVLHKLYFALLASYSNKFNLTNSILKDSQSVSPYNHHAYSLSQSAYSIKNQ